MIRQPSKHEVVRRGRDHDVAQGRTASWSQKSFAACAVLAGAFRAALASTVDFHSGEELVIEESGSSFLVSRNALKQRMMR